MIKVKKEGIILKKSHIEFENEGVLNPAVMREGDSVHLFYRAVAKGNHSSLGYCRLDGPLTIAERWDKPFMVPEFEYESQGVEDARMVNKNYNSAHSCGYFRILINTNEIVSRKFGKIRCLYCQTAIQQYSGLIRSK